MEQTKTTQQVFAELLTQKKAFTIDWKATLEDLIFNLKQILPEIKITVSSARVSDNDIETLIFENGNRHSFSADSTTLILDAVEVINKYLPQNLTLLRYLTAEDNYHFILISQKDSPRYLSLGFATV